MSKSGDRRSISIKGLTYARLKTYADEQGESMSGVAEEVIAEDLDCRGVPVPDRVEPHPEPEPEPEPEQIEEQAEDHFSF